LLYNKDMLSAKDARLARKVKRRLLEIASVKQLIVYGSRARGNPTKYSDLDLYIELDTKVNPELRRKIREIAWEVSLDSGVVISTLVASERLREQPILKAIRKEGITV
jgi:predicted nucleotidyltransferase